VGLAITESSTVWTFRDRDLTPYAGQRIRIAFYHTAGGGCLGWYIDDVEVFKFVPTFTGDFESGWGDWWAENGVWDVGTPTAGPPGVHSGSQCAGTILDGNYPGYTDSRLISPSINLPAVSGDEEIHLRLWNWFSYAAGDQGYVQVSVYSSGTWGPWENVGLPISVGSTVWAFCDRDLTPYAGERIRIAFYHTATRDIWGNPSESTGWYIDDVEVAKFTPTFTGDFESGWGDWGVDNAVWEVGTPTAGPSSAHSGSQCAATILGGNYPGGLSSRLISPPIDLPAVSGYEEIHLRFWHWFSYCGSDQGRVQVSVYSGGTWGTWENVGLAFTGSSPLWTLCDRDLTPYAGQRIRIAFYHTAGGGCLGWYIDDIVITAAITGHITEVNCDTLAHSTVCLYNGATLIGCTISDSGGYYELHAIAPGLYDVKVDKDGWRPETQHVTISNLAIIPLNFIGEKGLIPNAPTIQYVAQCSNHYLYPYGNCGLTVQRVAAVSNAYLYPVSE
jgi:hypothetical protein